MRPVLIALSLLAAAVPLHGQTPRVIDSRLRFVAAADVTAPAVTISTNSGNDFDNGSDSTADLTGTASDAVGVSSCAGSSDRTGSFAVSGTTSWTASNIALASGANVLSVWCLDAASNGSSATADTISVTYTPSSTSCGANCFFETSFTTAQGWEADKTNGCGSPSANDFTGEQTGVTNSGGWSTEHGNCDQVIAAANNPGGAGDRGFRHWRGDGWNNNGGGIRVNMSAIEAAGVTEFWLRWYMRYEALFSWLNGAPQYTKDLHFLDNDNSATEMTFSIGSASKWHTYAPARDWDSSTSWNAIQGGATGDGQFHCYEVHVKSGASLNGTLELWVDGTRVLNEQNATTNTLGGVWFAFVVGGNQAYPDLDADGNVTTDQSTSGPPDKYTDYDDIAVSIVGRISCL